MVTDTIILLTIRTKQYAVEHKRQYIKEASNTTIGSSCVEQTKHKLINKILETDTYGKPGARAGKTSFWEKILGF